MQRALYTIYIVQDVRKRTEARGRVVVDKRGRGDDADGNGWTLLNFLQLGNTNASSPFVTTPVLASPSVRMRLRNCFDDQREWNEVADAIFVDEDALLNGIRVRELVRVNATRLFLHSSTPARTHARTRVPSLASRSIIPLPLTRAKIRTQSTYKHTQTQTHAYSCYKHGTYTRQ